jgi:hypothetical protein
MATTDPLFPAITPEVARAYIALGREQTNAISRQIAEYALKESAGLFYAATPIDENRQTPPCLTQQKRAVEMAAYVANQKLTQIAHENPKHPNPDI